MKILTVVGARPNFVKAAVVSHTLAQHPKLEEYILHTGQHYDDLMNDLFFRQLEIPRPYRNLEVGSGRPAEQIGQMMIGMEKEVTELSPDWVLVYGDTNSTLAGALVASKLQIPLAHVEAGVRCGNLAVPEEVNRMVTDRVASALFVPTQKAVNNLKREGITEGIHTAGDVVVESIQTFLKLKDLRLNEKLDLNPDFMVLTVHRQENTDDPQRLANIFQGLSSSPFPIYFPVHPRTEKVLKENRISIPQTIRAISPISLYEMFDLVRRSAAVWTDSGGLQKEAAILNTPCFTLREETEWTETLEDGWNQLVGTDAGRIRKLVEAFTPFPSSRKFETEKHFGDGQTSKRIAEVLS